MGLVFVGCGGISNITTPSSTVEQGVIYLDRNGEEPCQGTYPLYAGQDNLVGEVIVTDDGETLCVEYVLDQDALNAGWLIYETHIAVGADAGDIPQTKPKKDETYGNPKVGNFLYGDDDLGGVENYEECNIPIPVNCGVPFVIAAHAVVEREVCQKIASADEGFWVSDTSTKVTAGNNIGNAVLTWVHPQWKLLVDNLGLIKEPAQWIWESYFAVHPVLGDVVTFEKTFEVPGTPVSGGTLWIVCDNSYAVYLNNVLLGSHNMWWEKKVYGLKPPALVHGENTLRIEAVNASQAGGNAESNPGGVKFSFCAHWDDYYECETESQTAWAAMCAPGSIRFVDQGNWATYFEYTTNECEE